MSFGAPEFLWFALFLVVPLLLYLLPMPRRLVAASALYLWQRFLASEPFGKTSERFRRALGFALLAAILACLVLAAADLLVGSSSVKARHVIVLVKSSASMNAVSGGKSNLDRAREAAGEMIQSIGGSSSLTIVEAADQLHVIYPMGKTGSEAVGRLARIQPFDGPVDLQRMLDETCQLWGQDDGAEIYVFTDAALPPSRWNGRAHAWIAPSAGGNVAVTGLVAQRRGPEVTVDFTVSNFDKASRKLAGAVQCNQQTRATFDDIVLEPGQSAQRTAKFDEAREAQVEVRLDGAHDALAADDSAFAVVPALDELKVAVRWPEALKRNDYVSAVLTALVNEGSAGSIVEDFSNGPVAVLPPATEGALPVAPVPCAKSSDAAVTVFVNHMPAAWPKGGSIVLYPLKSGAVEVAGLRADTLAVTRQAQHPLMADVDLRGLQVKGAVLAKPPAWADVLAWGTDVPLIWAGLRRDGTATAAQAGLRRDGTATAAQAGLRQDGAAAAAQAGQTGQSKVLFVGIPVMPSGSQLPLVVGFPMLMRNAMAWMLPAASARQAGSDVDGWTSRRAGFHKGPDGRMQAFSVLSAGESDLRRDGNVPSESFTPRHSLSGVLVVLAILLLPLEWGLFHKRLTE